MSNYYILYIILKILLCFKGGVKAVSITTWKPMSLFKGEMNIGNCKLIRHSEYILNGEMNKLPVE